jgi:hypothetical protein
MPVTPYQAASLLFHELREELGSWVSSKGSAKMPLMGDEFINNKWQWWRGPILYSNRERERHQWAKTIKNMWENGCNVVSKRYQKETAPSANNLVTLQGDAITWSWSTSEGLGSIQTHVVLQAATAPRILTSTNNVQYSES